MGGSLMKAWSKTIPTLALSTGEAELLALVKGATEVEGVRAILNDYGIPASIVIKTDASAAVGMTQRLGLGKVRHLAVSDLWIQQRVKRGDLKVEKTPGEFNPADLMTKGLAGARIQLLIGKLNLDSPCREAPLVCKQRGQKAGHEEHLLQQALGSAGECRE